MPVCDVSNRCGAQSQNTHELELNKTKIDSQEDHVFEMEKISESAKNKLESELAEQQTDLDLRLCEQAGY